MIFMKESKMAAAKLTKTFKKIHNFFQIIYENTICSVPVICFADTPYESKSCYKLLIILNRCR